MLPSRRLTWPLQSSKVTKVTQDTPLPSQKRKAESDEEDDEWEYDGSGRPPIPKRPAIPERPADNPGSADEDDDVDEKPQIVVLREGKHLSEREVENEKRRGQCGLLIHDARGLF